MKSSTIAIIIIAILIVAGIVYYATMRTKNTPLYDNYQSSTKDESINATADVDSINVGDIENELKSLETDLNQL